MNVFNERIYNRERKRIRNKTYRKGLIDLNTNSGKRWALLAMGTVILLCCGLIYGWSLFSQYFAVEYPTWSLSQLSMAFTISMAGFCLGGLFSGIISKKLSPKVVLWIAMVLIFCGFFGVSRMTTDNPSTSLIMLYICYGCFAGFGVGISYNVVISTVSQWFTDKSGVAIGTMMMGFGCGALVLGSLLTKLIGNYGLFKTYFILGVGIAVVLIIGSFVLKAPARDASVADDTPAEIPDSENDKPTSFIISDPAFWIFMVWAVLVGTAGMLVISNAASIATAAGAAAIVGMIVSVCNGAGRVIVGAIFDKLGRKKTMLLSVCTLLVAGVILYVGAISNMLVLTIVGLIIMGLQYGSSPIISSSFVRSQYGAKYYSSNFAVVNFNAIPAAICGPTIASLIVTASGGSYDKAYLVIIVCAAVSMAVMFLLNKTIEKGQK